MPHALIIEPDRPLAGSMSSYLAQANINASVHSDPQTAIAAADKRQPDIIILELQLAGRSGVEFIYEFRSYADWQNVPVIIFTALNPEQLAEHRQVIRQLNIAACLSKTESGLAGLLAAVRQAVPAHAQV